MSLRKCDGCAEYKPLKAFAAHAPMCELCAQASFDVFAEDRELIAEITTGAVGRASDYAGVSGHYKEPADRRPKKQKTARERAEERRQGEEKRRQWEEKRRQWEEKRLQWAEEFLQGTTDKLATAQKHAEKCEREVVDAQYMKAFLTDLLPLLVKHGVVIRAGVRGTNANVHDKNIALTIAQTDHTTASMGVPISAQHVEGLLVHLRHHTEDARQEAQRSANAVDYWRGCCVEAEDELRARRRHTCTNKASHAQVHTPGRSAQQTGKETEP